MTSPRRATAVALALASGVVALLAPSAGARDADPEPAARADVRVTINEGANAGVIRSPRTVCERRRGVTFLRRTEGDLFFDGSDVSDRNGRWATVLRRGGTSTVFAVVPGDRTCEVAQSGTRTVFTRGARPARVEISLEATGGTLRGRVESPRAGCERGTDVVAFSREDADSPWAVAQSTKTDRQGRYSFGDERSSRQTSFQLTTVALGTDRCAVAQSGIETVRYR